ncbi:MAG: hypothetical protein ABII64_05020 [Elusimicrobiota bacterium]
MRQKVLFLLILCFVTTFFKHAFAEATVRDVGSIDTFTSENKRYSIDIKILGYPDRSSSICTPSICTFKKGDKILWSKEIPATPGKVNISDNGKYIAMANWGWYDEGGYAGLSFYGKDGGLIGNIAIDKNKEHFKYIKKTAISRDGKYYLISELGRGSILSLYDVKLSKLLWTEEFDEKYSNNIDFKVLDSADKITIKGFDGFKEKTIKTIKIK